MGGQGKYEKDDLEAPPPQAQEKLQPAGISCEGAKADSADSGAIACFWSGLKLHVGGK